MTGVTKYVKDSAWHVIERDVLGRAFTEFKDRQRHALFKSVTVSAFCAFIEFIEQLLRKEFLLSL